MNLRDEVNESDSTEPSDQIDLIVGHPETADFSLKHFCIGYRDGEETKEKAKPVAKPVSLRQLVRPTVYEIIRNNYEYIIFTFKNSKS